MDTLSTVLLGTTILCGVFAFVMMQSYRKAQAALLRAEGERSAAVAERDIGQAEKRRLENDAAEAIRKLDEARVESRQTQERAERRLAEADKQGALMKREVEAAERRMKEFEAQEKRIIESTTAAVMKAGGDMSTKLLKDHEQKNEEAKRHASEVTGKLFEQFAQVTGRVEAMQRDGGVLADKVGVMMRTMTHPGGAGKMAEVGLENLLKSFALEPGRDFDMQFHIAGDAGSLRPDAIVYLPQNTVLVIDSKASKFMVELAEASGGDQEAAVFEQLRKTMFDHARGLAGKNYRDAVQEHYKRSGRADDISTVLSLMYFPSEAFIERLREDRKLYDFLQQHEIMLVGPTMLYGVCGLARTRLVEVRQAENQQAITEAVSALMENVVDIIAETKTMGDGIYKLSKAYNALVTKLNRNSLARMRRLGKLKVVPAKGKPIPAPLPTYDVTKHDEVLELEADDIAEDKVLAIRQG